MDPCLRKGGKEGAKQRSKGSTFRAEGAANARAELGTRVRSPGFKATACQMDVGKGFCLCALLATLMALDSSMLDTDSGTPEDPTRCEGKARTPAGQHDGCEVRGKPVGWSCRPQLLGVGTQHSSRHRPRLQGSHSAHYHSAPRKGPSQLQRGTPACHLPLSFSSFHL